VNSTTGGTYTVDLDVDGTSDGGQLISAASNPFVLTAPTPTNTATPTATFTSTPTRTPTSTVSLTPTAVGGTCTLTWQRTDVSPSDSVAGNGRANTCNTSTRP